MGIPAALLTVKVHCRITTPTAQETLSAPHIIRTGYWLRCRSMQRYLISTPWRRTPPLLFSRSCLTLASSRFSRITSSSRLRPCPGNASLPSRRNSSRQLTNTDPQLFADLPVGGTVFTGTLQRFAPELRTIALVPLRSPHHTFPGALLRQF